MKKKYIKYIISAVVVILIGLFSILIYINLFAGKNDTRFKDKYKYTLSDKEINSIKEKVNELGSVDSVDVYINSKIIKILVKLNEDVKFDTVKAKANEVIPSISEENLSYYDVEFLVDKQDSEIYPQIGYKFKANQEFSW